MARVQQSGSSSGTNDDAPPPDASERLRAVVEETYGPLTQAYERLEERLRPTGTGARPVGWAPYVEALRAFREQRITGDWAALARLLVAPAALDTDDVKLIEVTQNAAEAAHEIVTPLLSRGERALLLAPTAEQVGQITASFAADAATFVVQIDTIAEPETPPLGSTGTVPLTPVTEEVLSAPSTGTRPLLPVDSAPSAESHAPETSVCAAIVRPVGEAWRQAWQTEIRFLRRGLMSMEQWPRDAAAVHDLRAEDQRRRAELDAALTDLRTRIDELRTAATAAQQAVADAEREDERLTAELERINTELAEPRAEAQRLQAAADVAAAEANRLSQTADAAQARCVQLDGQLAHARTELQAAREQEMTLAGQLERARQDLPVATAEAERLQAASADAAAVAHAAYYRAVSAESALSARRRTMTLSQRLHVAAPPPELRELRAEAKARKREADDAAVRAAEAKQAAEQAELRRSGLVRFVNEGGAGLTAARQAQQRFDAEIIRLTAERETAAGEYRERAREAAEAVDRSTQATGAARHAHQAVRLIEERLAAVHTARQEAQAAAERSRTLAATATQRLTEVETELSQRQTAADEEHTARSAELAAAEDTMRRTRENVEEFCGTDPATAAPGQLETHQRRAMERIEQLTGHLESGDRGHDAASEDADLLLRTADLVCATPIAAATAPLPPSAEYDTLLVTDAAAVTDAQFLVGAIRTRHWILLGDPTHHPTAYPEYADDETLLKSPFTRCTESAPQKIHRPAPAPEPLAQPTDATMPVAALPPDTEPKPAAPLKPDAVAEPAAEPEAVPEPTAEPPTTDDLAPDPTPQPTETAPLPSPEPAATSPDIEPAAEPEATVTDAPAPTEPPAANESTPEATAEAAVVDEPSPEPSAADETVPDSAPLAAADVTPAEPAAPDEPSPNSAPKPPGRDATVPFTPVTHEPATEPPAPNEATPEAIAAPVTTSPDELAPAATTAPETEPATEPATVAEPATEQAANDQPTAGDAEPRPSEEPRQQDAPEPAAPPTSAVDGKGERSTDHDAQS